MPFVLFWDWDDYEGFLSPVMNQGNYGICWSVSLIRQLTCFLRMYGFLLANQELSIQHFLNQVAGEMMYDENDELIVNDVIDEVNWHLYDYEDALDIIMNAGLVNENLCPLNYIRANPIVYDDTIPKYCADGVVIHELGPFMGVVGNTSQAFEQRLVDALTDCPITVAVKWHPSYEYYNGERLYCPTKADFTAYLFHPETNKYLLERDEYHDVLAIARGIDEDGNHFVRVQDSKGENFGHGGFRDIALGLELFHSYITMDGTHVRY